VSYRIEPDEPVEHALRRVAHEQLDKALREIDDSELDVHRTVHQVRKRCKKLRALVRLVRESFDGYDDANRAFRDAARLVSDLRDAQVHVETIAALRDTRAPVLDDGVLAPIQRRLEAHRDELVGTPEGAERRVEEVRAALLKAEAAVDDWALDDDGYDAVAGGLRKTYGRARARMEDAYEDETVEAFHQWRKRCKYHRYHVRLLQDFWPNPLRALREELHDLTDLLGDAHDRAELSDAVDARFAEGEAVEARRALRAFLDQDRAELRARARVLGDKLFAEDADGFVARLGAIWSASRAA